MLKFARAILFIVLVVLNYQINAQEAQNSFCNPLNLSYRYQLEEPSRREAADPTVVWFKDRHYLFASKSGGYWHSKDLNNWIFVETDEIPTEDYAPTAIVIGDTLYFLASSFRQSTIYKTTDPLSGNWSIAKEKLDKAIWDPAFFLDTDNRLYLYWGIMSPIYGVELDYNNSFSFVGEPEILVKPHIDVYGWEISGDYNTMTEKGSFIEGAWMNSYDGKYYLQYATPGTQFKSYSDGVYVSENPLGPYTLQPTNPFSYKPEGFINGTGHGSTFQDKWGNYWHMGSMTISVNHKFERRLGMWPAFFDEDGTFYTYTGFGDFPHKIPEIKLERPDDYSPSAMLLSYKKPAEVSSSLPEHSAEHAVNEEVREYWSAATGDKGEWIMVDLQQKCEVKSIQINYADEASSILGRLDTPVTYQYLLEYSNDNKNWGILVDNTSNITDNPHDFIVLPKPIAARYIRLTNYYVPDGKFAISGLRIFGNGKGNLPQPVTNFSVTRDVENPKSVRIEWEKSQNTLGYNIRFGIQPDKLYQNYQVFDTDTLTINSLNSDLNYYFTIDCFNEKGITKGKQIVETEDVYTD